ncbi:hypothetical protein [Kitasatospora camelliae]|uniref:Uncharacterized protein n=1 Tax=Kitasatospora camelliae TaxID=3156397 RepID=A0AAU8JR50_9ACTN
MTDTVPPPPVRELAPREHADLLRHLSAFFAEIAPGRRPKPDPVTAKTRATAPDPAGPLSG